MVRRTFSLLAVALALAGCVQVSGPAGAPSALAPAPGNAAVAAAGTGPVALLAPLSGANAERGQVLVQAAQLALAAPGSPRLDVRDTGSTPAGAAAAARAALASGDALILGPLTASETAAVAAPARAAGVPVLAFTNDPAQAQPGVWTLGITPGQQVRRLVGAVAGQGKTHIAALLPPGAFGQAMASALTQAASAAGLPSPDIRIHDGTNAGIQRTLRELSDYANRRGPIDAQIKQARDRHTAEGRKEAAELARTPIPPPPFDVLLLADSGERLAWAASFLGYYDIDPPAVQVLGPGLWANPAARGGAELNGAWYAAPDPAARASFDADYQAKFGSPAPTLADMAYDAAAIARVIVASGGTGTASLARPEGYAGVDGILALRPDGTVRRGLAVFAIHRGGAAVVDPAPTAFAGPGI
ncbi:MAG: penicillin-binding protein activator [Rhodospirillales bacterium]|nr:penicillin-binding protein activator [Rhodospirillales bacterium]